MRRRPATRGRRLLLLMAVLAASLLAVPVASQGQTSPERSAAEDALERVQQLADGRGVRTGRELTVALAQLNAMRPALSRSDRRTANALLARPTDSADVNQPAGPYSTSARVLRNCSTHFCLHWVDSTNDAPPLANADACPTPDYIDAMRRAFEQSYEVENGQLGWQAPIADGARGGNELTDVYVKDIGDERIYGYAAPDPGQSTRRQSAFQVMDDDYAQDEFPEYTDPTVPMRVTAAHEYNHILQFGYDTLADIWMFEAGATWAEDKVFDTVDDWRLYMPNWAGLPTQPITYAGDGVAPSGDDLKMYGSAIWNHWIERRHGALTVRRAWEGSLAQDGFAPGAYDTAIRQAKPTASFETDFAEFAAATAEWQAADSGIREGTVAGKPAFPDVARTATLSNGVARAVPALDHTAYALYDVPRPAASTTDVRLTSKLLKNAQHVDGSIALVGRKNATGEVTKVLDDFDGAGDATVTLEDAGAYDRLTAVIVNADTSNAGFDGAETGDWAWTRDDAAGTLTAMQVTGTTQGRIVDETGSTSSPGAAATGDCGTTTVEREPAVTPTPTPTASATPTATPTVTPTPTPTPAPRTSLLLSRSTTKIRSAARTGRLSLFARTNKPGRLTARSSVDRATALRLRLGRRTTSMGTGRRTAIAPGRFRIDVRLTRRARAALKRQVTRTLRVKVRVTLVPDDGTPAVTRAISVLLRPPS